MNRIKTLYVGAHPDDIEFGCAGNIIKRIGEDETYLSIYTLCGTDSGLNVSADKLKDELFK